MKIALPTREGCIDDHFGHCDHYTVFTLDDERRTLKSERLDSPQGCGCKSNIAEKLADMGVKVLLAGNMGDGAFRILSRKGIKVVRGCSGEVDSVLENWLKGRVKDQLINCGHDDCPNH